MLDNIALIGFRGSGKTSLGKLLARHFSMRFIDLDQEIEAKAKIPITRIFSDQGEPAFRKLETATLSSVMHGLNQTVLSTGGGIVHSSESMRQIKDKCLVIYLQISKDLAFERLNNTVRPKLTNLSIQKEIELVLEERVPLYSQFADLSFEVHDILPEQNLNSLLSVIAPYREGQNSFNAPR